MEGHADKIASSSCGDLDLMAFSLKKLTFGRRRSLAVKQEGLWEQNKVCIGGAVEEASAVGKTWIDGVKTGRTSSGGGRCTTIGSGVG